MRRAGPFATACGKTIFSAVSSVRFRTLERALSSAPSTLSNHPAPEKCDYPAPEACALGCFPTIDTSTLLAQAWTRIFCVGKVARNTWWAYSYEDMRIWFLSVLLVFANGAYAGAQEGADVQAAARAYEQGQLAQLQNDYARAARFFEIAHRAAPAAAAIRSAIRNHHAAGALPRAATLSVVAAANYADDAETSELTASVLAEAAVALGRLDVTCAVSCSVSVDGHLVSLADGQAFSVYVLPGSHELSARFSTGEQSASFEVAAGAEVTQALEAPAAALVEPDPEPEPEPEPRYSVEPREPESSGMSPAVTYIGAGVTVALAGVFVWSLLDTSSASDDYKANPTQAGFDDGQGRVVRTGILGAAAGAAGVATLIIAIAATNWDSDPDDEDRASMPAFLPSAWASADGGGLAVSGALGRVQ